MPKLASAIYNPTDDKWWKRVQELGDNERQARQKAMDEAWRYYDGDMPPMLKTAPDGPNYNVMLDLVPQVLDTMVSFLGAPRMEVPGGVTRAPDANGVLVVTKAPAQEALDAFWEANDLDLSITDLELSGFIAGHSFLKLIEGEAGEPPMQELIDPRLVTVYYVTPRQPLFYRITWTVDDEETRIQDIVPESIIWRGAEENEDGTVQAEGVRPDAEGWRILEYRIGKSNKRELVGDDGWAYPFAPMVDGKNMPKPFSYYGKPDLNAVKLRQNDAANFVASNTQKIIYHHAGPQTVLTGGSLGEDVSAGPDTIIEVESADAKVYNLEITDDLASSQAHLTMIRGAFFEGARVVDRQSVKDKLGDLTNFAVRLLYGAQLDAGYQKQVLYGRLLGEAAKRALAMMGFAVEKVEAHWDDPLPQDRTEVVNAVNIENGLGFISKQTMTEELGHDPVQEAEQLAEEGDREQDRTADLLVGMGQRGLLNGNGNGRAGSQNLQ